jgi:hypothetical protein
VRSNSNAANCRSKQRCAMLIRRGSAARDPASDFLCPNLGTLSKTVGKGVSERGWARKNAGRSAPCFDRPEGMPCSVPG